MIAEMAQVEIAGPRGLLPDVLRTLQVEGSVQLRPLSVPLEQWRESVPAPEPSQARARLEAASHRLEELLRALPAPEGGELPAAAGEEPLPDPESDELAGRLDALAAELHALDERRAQLGEERGLLARYQRLLAAVAPLFRQLEDVKQVATLGVLIRRERADTVELLEEAIARLTNGAYTLAVRPVDEEQLAGLIAVPQKHAPAVSQLLFERGVSEVKLPERYRGRSFAESVRYLAARHDELPKEIEACENERRRLVQRWYGPLARARRDALDRLARLGAEAFCRETHHAFMIAGWAPRARLPGLAHALEREFGDRVSLFSSSIPWQKYDEVPVVLENPRWLRPFELLLSFQPLPRYRSIDPTPLLALFFPLYFGLILGDVGHGVIGLAIGLAAYRKRWGGELGRNVAAIAIVCSASAIVFGVLFGELFGELGSPLGMHPLLLDRKRAMLPLLGLVLALGGVQIALGLVLGAVASWRRGREREALSRLVTLLVIVDAALVAGSLGGALPPDVRPAALIALGPLLGAAILLEGLLAPLEMVRTLGNILSYARLMAVGLASVMLGEVANRLAELVRPAAVGIAAAVFLHTVNFTLGLLSPTIQALRLQYVEFFDKFFVPGGRRWAPLSLST